MPWARMHTAQCTSRVNAWGDGVLDGGCFTGSRFRQAVRAVRNAGDDELIPGMLLKLTPPLALGSGKPGTPWERMQREKLSPAWAASLWLELEPELPERLALLRDAEPHAEITAVASTAAATDASDRATRVMAHVVPVDRLHRHNGSRWSAVACDGDARFRRLPRAHRSHPSSRDPRSFRLSRHPPARP